MPRTRGFRKLLREEQLRQFYTWLPPELRAAPGICWEDLPMEVMAYAVRELGETLDAAPLAVAAAAMNGLVQAVTQVKALSTLAPLLCALRERGGMRQIGDLREEALWNEFATRTERTKRRSNQLAFYSSVAARYVPAYLQRLSPDERQQMQTYALPALPPGFLMQFSGDVQMDRVIPVAGPLTQEQIKEKIAASRQTRHRRRWEIIFTALVNPRPVAEIAASLGVSPDLVLDVLSSYNERGVSAVDTQGSGGRHHSYLTEEEEKQFVAPFLLCIQAGKKVAFKEARHAFEQRVGRTVPPTTVYRLFERHGMDAFTHPQISRHRKNRQ